MIRWTDWTRDAENTGPKGPLSSAVLECSAKEYLAGEGQQYTGVYVYCAQGPQTLSVSHFTDTYVHKAFLFKVHGRQFFFPLHAPFPFSPEWSGLAVGDIGSTNPRAKRP